LNQRASQKLAKFLAYILGRRPDEFGLILDAEGYCKIKDLLKVLGEEEGWRHVRRGHVEALLLERGPVPIEISDDRIRARDRRHLPAPVEAADLPKLLYTCIRRRAYPRVHEHGLQSASEHLVVLSAAASMAERIGRRRDAQPVLLTGNTAQARGAGVRIQQHGEAVYTCDHLPPDVFSGPPLPKTQPEPTGRPKSAPEKPVATPGSYFPELWSKAAAPAGPPGPKRRKDKDKDPDWKKARRRRRKG